MSHPEIVSETTFFFGWHYWASFIQLDNIDNTAKKKKGSSILENFLDILTRNKTKNTN